MDIQLSDKKRSYKLIPKSESTSASKTGAPPIHSLRDAKEFLNSINASSPLFWSTIWKQINAGSGDTSIPGNYQIIENIAQK
ncbi:hypothetical protein MNBD_GAMMA10-542, partial [hydrothermal vent metagenome]